jgi:nucleoside-diphosphate-sugar epimerase
VANDLSDPAARRRVCRLRCGRPLCGINREIGKQTFRNVHVEGTKHVVEAARQAGVKRIALMSFSARPANCGSRYHESSGWRERIVRDSVWTIRSSEPESCTVWAITCWTT